MTGPRSLALVAFLLAQLGFGCPQTMSAGPEERVGESRHPIVRSLLSEARDAEAEGEWKSALRNYRLALNFEPENAEARRGVAKANRRLEESSRRKRTALTVLLAVLSPVGAWFAWRAARRARRARAATERFAHERPGEKLWNCPNCHAPYPLHDRACPHCGMDRREARRRFRRYRGSNDAFLGGGY